MEKKNSAVVEHDASHPSSFTIVVLSQSPKISKQIDYTKEYAQSASNK